MWLHGPSKEGLDRLVVGIRDTQLSRRMQLDSALMLDKAKKHVLQTEAVQETHKKLVTSSAGNSRDNPVEVDAVTGGRPGRRPQRPTHQRQCQRLPSRNPDRDRNRKSSPIRCTKCGKEAHSRRVCPASEADCHRCGKRGHFGAQCRSKPTISQISAEKADGAQVDSGFLDTLMAETSDAVWTVAVLVDEQTVKFKVDTGTEITAISDFPTGNSREFGSTLQTECCMDQTTLVSRY